MTVPEWSKQAGGRAITRFSGWFSAVRALLFARASDCFGADFARFSFDVDAEHATADT